MVTQNTFSFGILYKSIFNDTGELIKEGKVKLFGSMSDTLLRLVKFIRQPKYLAIVDVGGSLRAKELTI